MDYLNKNMDFLSSYLPEKIIFNDIFSMIQNGHSWKKSKIEQLKINQFLNDALDYLKIYLPNNELLKIENYRVKKDIQLQMYKQITKEKTVEDYNLKAINKIKYIQKYIKENKLGIIIPGFTNLKLKNQDLDFLKKVDIFVNELNNKNFFEGNDDQFNMRKKDENYFYLNEIFNKKEIVRFEDDKGGKGGMELWNDKKKLYDILTNYYANTIINDEQTYIFNFQYLVNNVFNKLVDNFIKEEKIDDKKILFLFKGGTFLKMIYEKYLEYVDKDNGGIFTFKNNKYFNKRSDSDYGLNLFNQLPDFDIKLFKLLKKIHYTLHQVKEFIKKNITSIYNFNNITDQSIENILKELNESLKEIKTDRNDTGTETIISKIDEIVGIKVQNKLILKDGLNLDDIRNNIFNLEKIFNPESSKKIFNSKSSKKKINSESYKKINNRDNKYISKLSHFKKTGDLQTYRNDFYITVDKGLNDRILIPTSNETKDELNNGFVTNSIYFYNNETNIFKKIEEQDVAFILARLKINNTIIFRKKDKYGLINIPAELIDLSTPRKEDYKNKVFTPDSFDEHYQKYTSLQNNHKLEINSYSLTGLIEDYILMLEEGEFMWNIIKYQKRLYRVFLLMFVYLLINHNDKVKEYFKDIKTIFSEDNFENKKKKLKDFISKIQHIEIFQRFIEVIEGNADKLNTPVDKNEFNELSKTIVNIAEYILKTKINIPENLKKNEMNYLNKYLKYKKKYMELKKLM